MTKTTVQKLEQAFVTGASDEEACFYAGISKQTLYTYQKDNPSFLDRKELLKQRPFMVARNSIIRQMEEDGNLALKFMERRHPDFKPKTEIEVSSSLAEQEAKLKEFMDDNDDDAYPTLKDGADASSTEPTADAVAEVPGEVAQSTPDIQE